MRIIIWVIDVLLIIAGISFAVLNAAPVEINLYVTHISLPLALWMALVLALGIAMGFCLFIIRYWRLKVEHHKIKSQLKLMEREIKNLRSIPLEDQR